MFGFLSRWSTALTWHCRMSAALACLCLVIMCDIPVRAADAEGVQFFREKIEPALKAQCYSCHSRQADEVQGGLRLDFQAGVLRGGDSGPAIVPGKSSESLLIKAIRHERGIAMPPKKERKPRTRRLQTS